MTRQMLQHSSMFFGLLDLLLMLFVCANICHLKGSYKGKLLVAITKDANNNILHVAYAIVMKSHHTFGVGSFTKLDILLLKIDNYV
uniref:Secreted protein n=1 Tax=Lactuca sativa TaxID=4236 RepID=A0A9R1V8B3_LACSA|nr:hypothetical protein LSAT_V11C600335510 [Lactuca sativa]